MPGAWSSSPELVSPDAAVACCHRGLSSAGQSQRRVVLAAEFCAATADDELRVIEITPHDYRRMAELLTPIRHRGISLLAPR
jgi:hypothetical protein